MWPILLAGAIKAGTQIFSGAKQQRAAEANAELVEQEGIFQRKQAYDQATTLRKQGEAFKGSQRAGFASSGVKADRGSPLAVLNESRKAIQRDVSRTREAGDTALTKSINQANQIRKEGEAAKSTSLLGAGTTLLTAGLNAGLGEGVKNIFKKKPIEETWIPYGF
ncbi:hypothetical protein KAR91_70000 [Candidatus Pacearchaeota archaeon]|nr:hypothetical protein [Candidatus Pacearchaeota archaeon]